jgi:hypothetical protein
LETHGLAVEFPAAEVDQANPSLDEDVEDELVMPADTHENSSAPSTPTERAARLSSHLGEIALPDIDSDIDTGDNQSVVSAELTDETLQQPEAIGRVIMSATTEQADSVPVEYGRYEEDEAEPTLHWLAHGESQAPVTGATISMLGTLAITSPAETENDTASENPAFEIESLTTEYIALMALAAHERRYEQRANYLLAA